MAPDQSERVRKGTSQRLTDNLLPRRPPPTSHADVASRVKSQPRGTRADVFFLFSNRLGCLGSLAVSVIATLVLLFVLGVL